MGGKGGMGKGRMEFFCNKVIKYFFPNFLAFPIYIKYLDHCVALQRFSTELIWETELISEKEMD